MKIRKKVFLTIFTFAVSVILLLIIFTNTTFIKSFEKLEREDTFEKLEKLDNFIKAEENSLEKIVNDWAVWDDSYEFINKPSEKYILSNFTNEGFVNLKVNYIFILDNDKKLIYGKGYSHSREKEINIPIELLENIKDEEESSGIKMCNGIPLFFALHKVRNSSNSLPSNGILGMAFNVDENFVNRISEKNNMLLKGKLLNPYKSQKNREKSVFIHSNKIIIGEITYNDIKNNAVFSIQANFERRIYNMGKSVANNSLIIAIILFSLLTIIMLVFIRRSVVERIENFRTQVANIDYITHNKKVISMSGDDEVTELKESINAMLDKIDRINDEIINEKEKFEIIVENIPIMIVSINEMGKIVFWNRAAEILTGFTKKEVTGVREITDIVIFSEENIEGIIDFTKKSFMEKRIESDLKCKNGETKRIEVFELSTTHTIKGWFKWGIGIDITEKRSSEEKIKNSEEKYRTLYDGTAAVHIMVNEKNEINDINRTGAEVFGLNRDSLLGKQITDFILEEDIPKLEELVQNIFLGESNNNIEIRISHARDREVRTILFSPTDLLLSEDKDRFSVVITGIDISERKTMEKKLKELASIDPMTEVYNRGTGMNILEQYMKLSKRNGNSLVICFIDINGLKNVNDLMGHSMGDLLIKDACDIMKDCVRESDIVCRLGGDEFLIVLDKCEIEDAEDVWMRIEERITEFNSTGYRKYKVSMSHGMAQYKKDSDLKLDELVQLADDRMYEEKRHKKLERK